ncbi:hypothetical protein [Methylobacter sp.]|uniref:hypothetical protein n=1 Tax=Methylobacter sp. TaxID=2051955 RepID=UPI00122869DF|nr:hypothetical protein [Methylobacter sp.]TAK62746.1 MAG: hypothetical protein EPO18_09545 [Methylobacter sp.]
MKIRKYFLLSATVLALSLSGTAIAKQPSNHGNKYHESSPSDSSLLNSNKQSEEDSLRGQDRADERQEINQSRDHESHHGGNKPEKQSRKKQ